jgi:hypothetical protein
MEWSIKKIAKVAGIPHAVATAIAVVFFVVINVYAAIDLYYNHVTQKVLKNDVYGTIIIDGRTVNGVANRYLLSIKDGIVIKSKILSDEDRLRYPAPESLNIVPNRLRSHDGSKIAFYKHKRIYISDTLRNNAFEVIGGHYVVTPMEGSSIAWSPNDKYLAFCGQTMLGQIWPTYNLYLVPINRKNHLTTICYNVSPVFYWGK